MGLKPNYQVQQLRHSHTPASDFLKTAAEPAPEIAIICLAKNVLYWARPWATLAMS
jgi:hypothetical protein